MTKICGWGSKVLACLAAAALACAFVTTLAFYFKPSPPQVTNPLEIRLKGKSCEIWDDPQGIPHARAQTALEAYACFGYLHGRDRAWQMDYFKRVWQGRRAEILGPSEIGADYTMRLFRFSERGRSLFESLPKGRQELLWAYSYGVNRGMAEGMARGSYEFERLGYKPEPWLPQDSVSMLLLQSFDQTKESFLRQIDESEYLTVAPGAARGLFSRTGFPWDTSILKPGEHADAPKRYANEGRGHPDGQTVTREPSWVETALRSAGQGQGSNSWVLAPRRSATGRAWLANDPHLELKHPPFWHWVHVDAGKEFDVIGASLPGVPAIASGANRHVAWGITNSYLNVSRIIYAASADVKANSAASRPWIWFKVGPLRVPFVFKAMRFTSEGWPVLPLDRAPPGHWGVMRWTGFELTPEDLSGVFELMRSTNVAETDRALSRFGVPSWNFVFADASGRIGYRAAGKVPRNADGIPFGVLRTSIDGLRIIRGFERFLTPDEMPHVLDPKRGYVVTANNRQWPDGEGSDVGRAHADAFRAYRIEELLKAVPRHDLESNRRTQCDVQAVDSRFLLERMLEVLGEPADDRERRAVQALKAWDGMASLECRACAVYERWVGRMRRSMGVDLGALYRKLGSDDAFALAQVRGSLTQALDDLKIGESGELPAWRSVHPGYFEHLAGKDRFKAASLGTPGSDQSVNPGTHQWDGREFRHIAGASERLIVELTSPPRVYSVLAGSNQDLDRRGRELEGGEWLAWRDCQQRRREFPVDWPKVEAKRFVW